MRRSGLMMMLVFLPLLGTLLLFSVLLKTSSIPEEVQAASVKTWDGGGANGNWTTAANWDLDIAPVAGDILIFDATGVGIRPAAINNFANGTSFASITVSAAGYTLSGTSVSLTGGLVVDTYATGTSTVSLIVGGAGSVTMNATDTAILILSGVNTFTGGLTINSGTLRATTSNKALGGATGTGTVTLGNTSGVAPATLQIGTTGLTYANPIVLATNPTVGTLTIGNTGTAISTTFSGGVTGTNNLTINANATTGTITFSTARVNNAGTVTNLGAGTGTVTISAGTGANVTGVTQNSITSALTITTGGIIVNAGGTTLTNVAGTKLLTVTGGVSGTGNLILNNNSTLANGITFTTTGFTNTGTIINSGTGIGTEVLSVALGATVTGVTQNSSTSVLTLSGVNTAYAGTTTLTSGTLKLGSATALGGNGSTTGTGGPLVITGGILDASAAFAPTTVNAQQWNGNFTFGGSFAMTFGTGAVTVGVGSVQIAKSGSTLTTVGGAISGTSDLTFNVTGTSGLTLSGGMNTVGTLSNLGSGAGTMTISGAVSSGVTAITQNSTTSNFEIIGALTVNSAGTTLTNTAGTKYLAISGGTVGTGNIILNNNSSLAEGITLSPGSTNNVGDIVNSGTGSGSVLIDGSIGTNVVNIVESSLTSQVTLRPSTTVTKTTGAGNEEGWGIATDSQSSIYVTGYFAGTVDFDPGAGTDTKVSAGGSDIYLTKMNADGSYAYTKTFGGISEDVGWSVAVDYLDNVYLTGYFNGTADFDPGAGVENITSTGTYDTFIIKLGSDGTYEYVQTFGGTGITIGSRISADASGNLYFVGFFNGTNDFDPGVLVDNRVSAGDYDAFLVKINSDGSYAYARTFGGIGNDRAYEAALTSDEDIYMVGQFNGTADFDPGVGVANKTSAGGSDIYLTKLDSSGAYVYAYTFGGITDDVGTRGVVDRHDNVYFTGYFSGTADFDPTGGTDNITSAGSDDVFLVKIDNADAYVHTQTFGGTAQDRGQGCSIDLGDNIYINGFFNGTADFDPTGGVDNITSAGGTDIFTIKIDADGAYAGTDTYGGTGGDVAYEGITDRFGNSYVTGFFVGIADFEPSPGIRYLTAGGRDMFLAKTTPIPAFATESILTPPNSTILATGGVTAILTVTARDRLGNAVDVGGSTVVISKTSGTGTVGAVTDVGDGTYTAAVISPFVAGSGTFVATLDGYAVKGGSGSQTEITITYTAHGGSSIVPINPGGIAFTALMPSTLRVGDLQPVAWTTSGEQIQTVQLDVSYDGGVLWTPIVNGLSPFATYSWTVPDMPANQVILRIIGYDVAGEVIDQQNSEIFAILSQDVVLPPPQASGYAHLPVIAVTTAEGDALAGITLDASGQRVAPRTSITGLSPLDGSLEAISIIQTGWLIRSENYNTVYYIGSDGMRHAFWDTQAYFTWSETWNDVVWVTDATLPTLQLGTPVLAKPRVVLVKVNSDPNVYQVDADEAVGSYRARKIDSEEIAISIYGANWADYVIDVDPTLMGYYLHGAGVTAPEVVDLSIMKTRAQLARLASAFEAAKISPIKLWMNTLQESFFAFITPIYQKPAEVLAIWSDRLAHSNMITWFIGNR